MRDGQTITKQTGPLLYNPFGSAAQLPVTVTTRRVSVATPTYVKLESWRHS